MCHIVKHRRTLLNNVALIKVFEYEYIEHYNQVSLSCQRQYHTFSLTEVITLSIFFHKYVNNINKIKLAKFGDLKKEREKRDIFYLSWNHEASKCVFYFRVIQVYGTFRCLKLYCRFRYPASVSIFATSIATFRTCAIMSENCRF